MDKAQATDYLTNLLNRPLRITTTDTRLFIGEFKCTDSHLNIILAHTYEFRTPVSSTPSTLTPSTITPLETEHSPSPHQLTSPQETTAKMPHTSRYVGLVVLPGEHITRIELEEFASQARKKEKAVS